MKPEGVATGDSVVDLEAQHAEVKPWREAERAERIVERRNRVRALKALWRAGQAVKAARAERGAVRSRGCVSTQLLRWLWVPGVGLVLWLGVEAMPVTVDPVSPPPPQAAPAVDAGK